MTTVRPLRLVANPSIAQPPRQPQQLKSARASTDTFVASSNRAWQTFSQSGTNGTNGISASTAVPGDTALRAATEAVLLQVQNNRAGGVGTMSQVALDTAIAQFSAMPELRNPDGTVDQARVMDYAMACCANIFTGKGAVLEGIDRIPGASGTFRGIVASMPELDGSFIHGRDVATWRASLDSTNGSTIRPDLDDGSGGQARHTWVFIAMGYAAPLNTLSQTVLLAGNWAHESLDGGGTRQDFSASFAGGSLGMSLRFLRDRVTSEPAEYGQSLTANLGSVANGFFTGNGNGAGIAVFDEAMRNLQSIPAAWTSYQGLPWADTGRQSTLPQ